MEVTVAKSAGFCFGVKRAVDTVYREIESGEKPVYTFGPIIHNEQVVEDLENRGVQVIHSEDELEGLSGGTVVIRSHGVAEEVYDLICENGLNLADATCPFVKKIHRIVRREGENGREIVIIGNANHPEVEGIRGWCVSKVTVIGTEEEAEEFEPNSDTGVCVVSQTTFNYKKFNKLVEILSKKGYDIIAVNTICNATAERQKEAEELAAVSDAMIVIGGKNSSNSRKLFEISKNQCENTYFIQTLEDLNLEQIQFSSSLGITAGASTPKNIIQEVLEACQKKEVLKNY